MAQAFNLTAQLQLQAPGNTSQVMNQIRRQLKPIGVQVNIQNTRNIAQANRSLSSFNKNAQASTKSMGQLNRTLQESARRFSVITIATGSFLALANSFKKSVKEAVAFEREIIKIAQVTGKSVSQLSSLSNEVTRLGTSLGASSADLLNVARTLTQAGFAAEDTRKALDILAKTSLGATFNNIQDTTEGAIALLRQFSNEAKSVGSDVKFLENSLDAINAVSKRFAVESADLVTAIRRTGGVFSAAGGSVNELIALFTSVRATTRESAETIATGLRTIFTRIQRPESITQLRNFGIELQDAQGNFVGAFEAFKRLSQGLRGLDARSTAFSQIVEDLGGFRQVGKVIPLIQQFTTAQKALSVAQSASGSIAKDAETAQQSLGVQIQKTREEFDALIRKFVDSSAFRSLAKGGLELAKAFIDIANSLEPLLPMLITLAGLKLGRGLAPALGSFAGIGKSVSGAGPVTKFARGGMVPGSGNRDTVPAMLTPGEFVIKKSSVSKLGAGTLAAMNENRFNEGSRIREQMAAGRKPASTRVLTSRYGSTQVLGAIDKLDQEAKAALNADLGTYGGAFLRPEARDQVVQGQVNVSEIQESIRKDSKFAALKALASKSKTKGLASQVNKKLEQEIKGIAAAASGSQAGFVLRAGSLESDAANSLEDSILGGITQTVRESTKLIGGKLGTDVANVSKILKTANIDNVVGNIFEATLLSAGVPFGDQDRDSSADFDFPSGLGNRISKLFGLQDIAGEQTDAKSSFTNANIKSFIKKVKNVETKKSIKDIDSRLTDDFAAIKEALNATIMQEGGMRLFGQGIKGTGKDQKDRNLAMTKAREGILNRNSGGIIQKYAKGGAASDTVPALLTPGEFVFNRDAAQSIGYSNLNRMNKQGVQGYAKGGAVGIQSFANGTGPGGVTAGAPFDPNTVGALDEFISKIEEASAL